MNNHNNNDYNRYNDYSSPGPGPGKNRAPAGNFRETLTWIIDVMMIFVWFPVGLFLTIARSLGHDFVGMLLDMIFGNGSGRKGYGAKSTSERTGGADPHVRHRTSERTGGGAQTADASRAEPAQKGKPTEEKPGKAARTGVRRADGGAGVKTVFGWILAAFGLVGTLAMAGTELWGMLTYLAVALGGGALILSGITGRKKEAKFARCMTVSGSEGLVDMEKLARTMGMDTASMAKLLTEMIDRGYYGPRAYIDHERGLLVIQPEAMRDVYRAEDEEKTARAQAEAQAEKRRVQDEMSEYERYVEAIRQADEDIEDEVMSEKIRRMQTLTAAIFREVEEHPEKKSQIHRFMNYYLPTTLKLLKNYARIEEQGVSGQNMAKAKADIEGIADTLVAGYEKQLDTLYRAEAMDVAGDVSLIENMMKRDGLTDSKDFGQTLGGT